MAGIVMVSGTFTVEDDKGESRKVQFTIDAEDGYQQWGEAQSVLALTLDAVQVMEEALREAEVWALPEE